MKRRTRKSNRTNWNEVAMCVGATVFGIAILATIVVVQMAEYSHWVSQL